MSPGGQGCLGTCFAMAMPMIGSARLVGQQLCPGSAPAGPAGRFNVGAPNFLWVPAAETSDHALPHALPACISNLSRTFSHLIYTPAMQLLASVLCTLLCAQVHLAASASLSQIIAAREAEVKAIATKATQLMSGGALCDSAMRRSCGGTCHYNSCSQAPEDASCADDFGIPEECSADGQMVSKKTSGIKLGDDVILSHVDRQAKRSVIADVCSTPGLDSLYAQQLERADAQNTGLKWQYFGSSHGMYRFFPGNVWGTSGHGCSAYDPRQRSWYVAAASGSKRMTLIIDTSGSMSTNSRLELAKAAAISVIQTLTNADSLAIVGFSTNPTPWRTQHVVATAENKAAGIAFIKDLTAGGGTYYARAFNAAYTLMKKSRAQEIGENACREVIMFLTDGESSDGSSSVAVADLIRADFPSLHVFSYSLGYGAGSSSLKTVPKALACRNSGVWAGIGDFGNLRAQMSGYYNFLATGLQRTDAVWTEPYEDALGLGEVVTAAMPVYDSTFDPPILMGVAGVDIQFSKFTSSGEQYSDILRVLVARSSRCGNTSLTDCQLAALQAAGGEACDEDWKDRCGNEDISDLTCTDASSGSVPATPFTCGETGAYGSSYEDVACCAGLSPGLIAGIVIGGVVGVVLIAVVVKVFAGAKAKAAASAATVSSPPSAQPAQPSETAPHSNPQAAQSMSYPGTQPPPGNPGLTAQYGYYNNAQPCNAPYAGQQPAMPQPAAPAYV